MAQRGRKELGERRKELVQAFRRYQIDVTFMVIRFLLYSPHGDR